MISRRYPVVKYFLFSYHPAAGYNINILVRNYQFTILLSLKNLAVLTNTKLHSKSFYCLFKQTFFFFRFLNKHSQLSHMCTRTEMVENPALYCK